MGHRAFLAAVVFAGFAVMGCNDDPKPNAPGVDASIADAPMCNGTKALFEACALPDDCESCVCKAFGHAVVCTQACTVAEDCPDGHACTNNICQP